LGDHPSQGHPGRDVYGNEEFRVAKRRVGRPGARKRGLGFDSLTNGFYA